MNGWCDKCGGVERVESRVLVPIREADYQFRFEWANACQEGHAMSGLCEICQNAQPEPGYDYCVTCNREAAECEAEFKRDMQREVACLTKA